MARMVGLTIGSLLGIVAALVAFHLLVAELSGPVAVLTTWDEAGSAHETHLWIVEYEGARYLNAGTPDAAWLARIELRPEVEVERDGVRERVNAVPVPELREPVLALMRERYGFGDRWVRGIMGYDAVPVRLDPAGAR